MDDLPVEWRRGPYLVSTDRARIEIAKALALLRTTHWADALTEPTLSRAVAHSVCFGVYHDAELVGFGRVITDLATYGYLTDVVIAPEHRGRGLGGWLAECMVRHPRLQGFRRLALLTRDAEGLYAEAGFVTGAGDLIYMERREGARRDDPPGHPGASRGPDR
jgi:N-acetylglutamate synthase-like GNAT family acetyltransferase